MHAILAINESEFSGYARDWFVKNVLKEAHRVTVVTVIEPPVNLGYYYSERASEIMDEVNSKAKANAEKTAQGHVDAIQAVAGQVPCKLVVLEGEARDQIVDFTNEEAAMNPDGDVLLVMGSRDMGGLKRAFVGSTSDYCVHHCHTPVLIVKQPHHQ